jgi:hypothetical protein
LKANNKDFGAGAPQSQRSEKITLDYFLYSCFEHENTSRSWPIHVDSRWPDAVACSKHQPSETIGSHDFAGLCRTMITWYQTKYPALASSEPLNMENLADIVPPFMSLIQDLDIVVKTKTDDYLPTYEAGAADPIWQTVNAIFTEHLPTYAPLFLRYLHWSHAPQPEEIEFEPGSRPPVGRFAPGFRRPSPGAEGGRGPSHRPGLASRPQGNQRRDSQRGGRSGNSQDRPSQPQKSAARPKNTTTASDGRQDAGPDKKRLERESLREVLVAIQKLNEDLGLSEYRLRPANSFYRRLQHQQVKEEGLHSMSAGEGNDRAVVVLRYPPPPGSSHS